MSCAQVMYQPYSSPYLAYDRSASAPPSSDEEKKYKLGHDPTPAGSATSTPDPYGPRAHNGGGASSSSPGSSPPIISTSSSRGSQHCPVPGNKEDSDTEHKEAQYISANCVVFTHYSGDVSSVVDEHFSRALSHSYGDAKTGGTKGAPLSQRNFPASFWNSAYQPAKPTPLGAYGTGNPHAHDLYSAAGDPYHPATSLHAHPLSQAPDPWHYPLSSQPYAAHSAYPSVSSVGSSTRFNPGQYGSFLLQPPAPRGLPPAMTHAGQCAVKAEGWAAGRYHEALATDLSHPLDPAAAAYGSAAAAAHAYGNMAGLEGPVQESGKDLYWF